jgi:TonB family protein
MNRLQKNCLIVSAGMHLLLIVILVVGPAFRSSNDQADNLPVLDFVPVKTVDALVSGGGNPKGQLPAPAPSPPRRAPQAYSPPPAPAQPPESKPRPAAPEPVKESQEPHESLETGKPRQHRIEVSTRLVTRDSGKSSSDRSAAERRAREAADARRHAAAAIGRVVAGIQDNLSGSTSIELKGPGGGGLPYANWREAVKSVYDRAWILPSGVTSDSASAEATVTIARDGTVVSANLVKRSGNATVDESVRVALDRVRYAAPLPDDAKEDQRTIPLVFDVRAKLLE